MDPLVIDFTICDRMKKARQRAGLKQLDLARLLGVELNTCSRWENNPQPTVAVIIAWAYFTGCPVDWLAGKDIEISAPTAGFEPATHGSLAQVLALTPNENATNDLPDAA